MNKAIFFDRDGVLIKDNGHLTQIEDIEFAVDVFPAFRLFKSMDFKLIVVTNQAVVARGMIDEAGVSEINQYILDEVYKNTGCKIEKFYFCPHHPNANIEEYRENCECRKPKPGMLMQAAREFGIDLSQSYMIGDRLSDVIAGAKAGCKTILLATGKHEYAPIESDAFDLEIKPDFTCSNLTEAVEIINKTRS